MERDQGQDAAGQLEEVGMRVRCGAEERPAGGTSLVANVGC